MSQKGILQWISWDGPHTAQLCEISKKDTDIAFGIHLLLEMDDIYIY